MIRRIAETVVVFDAEWVPDPATGRRVYGLSQGVRDDDVRAHMWSVAGGTSEKPHPYLKTVLCRVVSIAAVVREQSGSDAPTLSLRSVPRVDEPALDEREVIDRFLERGIGGKDVQLVGFNSANADIPILVQRGVATGLSAPGFSQRPDKPWEGRDFFVRHGDWSIDLMSILTPWGRDAPSLHEMASASGIPGKMDTSGAGVLDLWLAGETRKIIEYNQYDALTTYLLWLRIVHFAGLMTASQYAAEQRQLEDLLERHAAEDGSEHLLVYLDRWRGFRHQVSPKLDPGD